VNGWALKLGLTRLEQINPDNLDEWKCSWNHSADRPADRIGKTTGARRLELIKRFTTYCRKMGWIEADPALDIEAISPDQSETLPLLGGRYEAVIAATYRYDEEMRPDDQFGEELRSIIELMRWTGLRISDAVSIKRQSFENNRLRLRLQKTQNWHTVIVPDRVISALLALPVRSTCDPIYYFWSGTSKLKSLTGQWQT
jgi:site-specific recombinase XerD